MTLREPSDDLATTIEATTAIALSRKSVAVRDGVVVLPGRVSSDLDRARAEAIAPRRARGAPRPDRLQVAPAG